VNGAAGARTLQRLGFTRVFNLEGGVNAWVKDNLPLTKTAAGSRANAK
jgi:rhodanese-related sulfurtransferase